MTKTGEEDTVAVDSINCYFFRISISVRDTENVLEAFILT